MNRSTIDRIIPLMALAMAATGTAARNGATIDLSLTESPTDSLTFKCMSNGGTAQFSIEHSDNGSSWSPAPADFVVADAALGLAPLSGAPVLLGYVGNKQFVRVVHAAPSATAFTSAVAVLGLIARSNAVRTIPA